MGTYMTKKRLFTPELLPLVAFLVGLAAARTLPQAQAQSCTDTYDRWDVQFVDLERLEGDGDREGEEDYWVLGGILESSPNGGIRFTSDTVALTGTP